MGSTGGFTNGRCSTVVRNDLGSWIVTTARIALSSISPNGVLHSIQPFAGLRVDLEHDGLVIGDERVHFFVDRHGDIEIGGLVLGVRHLRSRPNQDKQTRCADRG